MKRRIKFIIVLSVSALLITSYTNAQSRATIRTQSVKKKEDAKNSLSVRAQSLYDKEETSPADMPWMRTIYRTIDLKKEANMPLYYPEESTEEQDNMFRMIINLVSQDKIVAYEYLDGKEIFTDQYKMKVKDMLDRFHILYTEKGENSKTAKFEIDPSDVPTNEVLSYYIKEKWVFDKRNSGVKCEIEAVCPILHREGDFGGEAVKYPMFWIRYADLRPYLAQQYIVTSNENNVRNYTLDDFFKLRMFEGEIYKTLNMRNMSLMQLYPEQSAQDSARLAIENQLKGFENGLWVKNPDEIKTVQTENKTSVEKEKSNKEELKSTRSSRSSDDFKATSKGSKSSSKSSGKSKQPRAAKSQAPVRSVRSTK